MLESESVINVFEILSYLGHILAISWGYLGHLRHTLGVSWAYLGHISGISKAYFGHILDISWGYLGHIESLAHLSVLIFSILLRLLHTSMIIIDNTRCFCVWGPS